MTIANDNSNYLYVPDELQGVQGNNPLERIANNQRINDSADDPANLVISDQLRLNQSGLTQGLENINSGLAYTQIGDDALAEQSDILNTIRERTLLAATDTTSDDQRESIRQEITDLLDQFDNIASNTKYGDQNILQNSSEDKSPSNPFVIQSGKESEDTTSVSSIQSNTEGLNLRDLLNDGNFSADDARATLDVIDSASSRLNEFRSELGSTAQQLESSYTSLSSQVTNNGSALATISNIDYSKEVESFSKQNILAQIGAFGQAQANNINQQQVLRLLTT